MTNRKKIIIISCSALSVLLILAAALVCAFVHVQMSALGEDNTFAEVYSDFECDGCKAKFLFFDISDRIVEDDDVNTDKLGVYTVRYSLRFLFRDYECYQQVTVVDSTPPKITLKGEDGIIVSAMSFYKEPGFDAFDNYDGDITGNVDVSSVEDDESCIITYTVADSFGNVSEVCREIVIKDIIAPVMTLNGEAEMTTAEASFTDPGCSAADDLDGDISKAVTVETDYVPSKEGSFTFVYSVTDKAGNKTQVQRHLTVEDTQPPVIMLKGNAIMYVCVGGAYTDSGCSAHDAFDGDVSGKIATEGSVDTSRAGSYVIKYSAADSKSNIATVSRKVVVYERPVPVEGAVNGGGVVSDSTVYLTFDDGPSGNVTPRILDILASNNVKATFFIVNYSNDNKYLVSRMLSEGHTVAIHGYSHDYSLIYSSVDAFLNNINTLRQKLVDDFGYNTNLFRFPGGSSNLVSRSYCPGIMSNLAPLTESMGYRYFDWNVSSGDAAGAYVSSGEIYNNVISGLRKGRGNVVLMHDAASKSTTADALQGIIDYGYANGYTFAALSSYSDGAHHNVQN